MRIILLHVYITHNTKHTFSFPPKNYLRADTSGPPHPFFRKKMVYYLKGYDRFCRWRKNRKKEAMGYKMYEPEYLPPKSIELSRY